MSSVIQVLPKSWQRNSWTLWKTAGVLIKKRCFSFWDSDDPKEKIEKLAKDDAMNAKGNENGIRQKRAAECSTKILRSSRSYIRKDIDRKVSIIGVGWIGTTVASALLQKALATEVCLVDVDEKRVKGEIFDMEDAAHLAGNTFVTGGVDFKHTVGSKIIILCASSASKPTCIADYPEISNKIELYKDITKKILDYNEDPIFIIVSYPDPILAYAVMKETRLPVHRIIGIGTMIDTARLKSILANIVHARPSEITGFVVGQQGANSIPIWSSIGIQGQRLRDACKDFGRGDFWKKVHEGVTQRKAEIVALKHHACWSTATCVATLVSDIFNNTGRIRCVSTQASKFLNQKSEVFVSLPCVINRSGITSVLKLRLDKEEESAIHESANVILNTMKRLSLSEKIPRTGKRH